MPPSIPEQVAALEAAVASLQGRTTALETALPPVVEVANRLPWADPLNPPQPPETP